MTASDKQPMPVQHDVERIEGIEPIRTAAAELAAAARREILILSTDLQAHLYDQDDFLESLRQLAISTQHARIRILVSDLDPAIKHGHRLIELARQLSTFIKIRRLHSDDAALAETFLLVDQAALLHQSPPFGLMAMRYSRARFEGRQRALQFETLWERAELDPNLRRLWL